MYKFTVTAGSQLLTEKALGIRDKIKYLLAQSCCPNRTTAAPEFTTTTRPPQLSDNR